MLETRHARGSSERQYPPSTCSLWLSRTQQFYTGVVIAAITGLVLSDEYTRAGELTNQNEHGWVEALDPQNPFPSPTLDHAEQLLTHEANQSTRHIDMLEEERIAPVRIHNVTTADQPLASTDPFAVIGDIYTDNGRTEYGNEIAVVLDQVKQIIHYAEQSTIRLEAHCDDRQTSAYSLVIGEQRARNLAALLQMTGVEEKRIQVVSYGREQPSCGQWTINCWEDNLRMQQIFRTLAFKEPLNGCFVRINIQGNEEIVHYLRTTAASAFLKKIHLANPTGRKVEKQPHVLTH